MNQKTKKIIAVLLGIALIITIVGTYNFYQYLNGTSNSPNINVDMVVDDDTANDVANDKITIAIDDGKDIDKDTSDKINDELLDVEKDELEKPIVTPPVKQSSNRLQLYQFLQ